MKQHLNVIFVLTLLLVGVGLPRTTFSQVPYLVKDIWPGSDDSSPRSFTVVNGTLFFSADDGTHGEELWKSDGTAAGTVLVKDINPGNSSFYWYPSTQPEFIAFNGQLFFSAYNGSSDGLWKSDGTATGTVLVKEDILAKQFTIVREPILPDVLFFSVSSGSIDDHRQLWKSDGTKFGTVMVREFSAETIESFTAVDDMLFFSANDGEYGDELWKSNGTTVGTVLVKDINEYLEYGSRPDYLTDMKGTLFFSAWGNFWEGIPPDEHWEDYGRELWKSDGTDLGTVMIKDIVPGNVGSNSSVPRELTNVNGTLFFNAGDGIHGRELWKSDGTAAGTVLVKDILPGSEGSQPENPSLLRCFTNVNGVLFFLANDGIHGDEIWRSEGSESNTVLVKDITPSDVTIDNYPPRYLTDVDGMLFFNANDGIHGRELWKSNGTATGTFMVSDIIWPGNGGSAPQELIRVNDMLFFRAWNSTLGWELWALPISPEINVKQGSTDIPNNTGRYDFGSMTVGSSNTTTFTIENIGIKSLHLTGNPKVQIPPGDFSVIQQPISPVTPDSSTTFTVRFAPTAIGTRTAVISIANNDSDENPYTFTITGTGVQPPAADSYLLWTK